MKSIILCGAPGSGKGTQSDLLVKKYGFKHISTGDLLRKEIADGTELGKSAQTFISAGQLVPDDVIIGMIANKLDTLKNENASGIIFDGFPRTVAQAESLEKLLEERGEKTDILIDIEVDEQELINRLLLRGQTSGRSDDNMETIKKRLDVYHTQTKPVSEFYNTKGKYKAVHGMGTIEEIFGRIGKTFDPENK